MATSESNDTTRRKMRKNISRESAAPEASASKPPSMLWTECESVSAAGGAARPPTEPRRANTQVTPTTRGGEHRPMWLVESDEFAGFMTPSAVNFRHMRQHVVSLTVEQCAAYLRVSTRSVRGWESGERPVPFMAFEALRLVSESVSFRLSHPEWLEWRITTDGELCHPNLRRGFSSDELQAYAARVQQVAHVERERRRLEAALAQADAENARLRELLLSQGVVEELHEMKDRLVKLLATVGAGRVIEFRTGEDTPELVLDTNQRKESAA